MSEPKTSLLKQWFFWAWVVLLLGFALLTFAIDFKPASIAQWFETAAQSVFAIPATILIYMLGAFASAPQWMLHGGAVFAFGPVQGAIIAWVATMISASFDFWLGRRLGTKRVRAFGGNILNRLIETVKSHGFLTALLVRIVPTGPFVLVNLAAGVSGMRFFSFFLGTAIGILPKIIAVAFFGEGIQGTAEGKGPLYIAIVIGIAFIWMAGLYWLGNRLGRKRDAKGTDESPNS